MNLHEAYHVLGLPRHATAAEVKASYRRLVAGAHPDRGGQAAEFIRIRAAYEILIGFLQGDSPDDEIPIPADLRNVIDRIVGEFREQRLWAETETLAQLRAFEEQMASHIRSASRSELREFSSTFRDCWDTIINALFEKCNSRCDSILQRYESWYTESTQAVFDGIYHKELLHFAWRRRFWEIFLVLGAIAGALTVVVGWGAPVRRWVSVAMIAVALGLAFLAYRWWARHQRKTRERVEPLSVVPFAIRKNARFETEAILRRGRRTTTAMGLAGLFLGNAASGGLAVPIVGAAAGAALGGVLDRLVNPTGQMRRGMEADLRRFMGMARSQVTGYVLEAHEQLLEDVRHQITASYRERSKGAVKLLTAGRPLARRVRGNAARGTASRPT